jgi:hypothetical protein
MQMFVKVDARVLCVQEGEKCKIWLVCESPGPEHVENPRILFIADRVKTRVWTVLHWRRQNEFALPVCTPFLREAGIRVLVTKDDSVLLAHSNNGGKCEIVNVSLFHVDVFPVIHLSSSKSVSIVQSSTKS